MIQQKVIDWVLYPFIKLSQGMSDKMRDGLFVTSCTAMIVRYIFADFIFRWPYFVTYLFSVVCILGMVIATVTPHMRPISFCKAPLICWFATGFIMLATAIAFNMDWISEAVLFLVICPILYLIWGQTDFQRLFRLMMRSVEFSFYIYLVGCCMFVSIEEWQYSGLFINPNGAAFYLVLVFAVLLVDIFRCHPKKWVYLWRFFLLGVCSSLLIYTDSRTGMLSASVVFLFMACFAFLRDFKTLKWKILTKILCGILAMLALMPTTLYLIHGGNVVCQRIDSYNWQQMFHNTEEGMEALFGDHLGPSPSDTVDSITTGRISIWREYLKSATWYGSGEEERFWVESRHTYYTTAHMNLVTYAFRHGYVCAVLFLAFNIIMGLRAVIFAWKRKKDYYATFPLIVSLFFGMVYLFGSINTPFCYMLTIFYYFVQAPLLVCCRSKPCAAAEPVVVQLQGKEEE